MNTNCFIENSPNDIDNNNQNKINIPQMMIHSNQKSHNNNNQNNNNINNNNGLIGSNNSNNNHQYPPMQQNPSYNQPTYTNTSIPQQKPDSNLYIDFSIPKPNISSVPSNPLEPSNPVYKSDGIQVQPNSKNINSLNVADIENQKQYNNEQQQPIPFNNYQMNDPNMLHQQQIQIQQINNPLVQQQDQPYNQQYLYNQQQQQPYNYPLPPQQQQQYQQQGYYNQGYNMGQPQMLPQGQGYEMQQQPMMMYNEQQQGLIQQQQQQDEKEKEKAKQQQIQQEKEGRLNMVMKGPVTVSQSGPLRYSTMRKKDIQKRKTFVKKNTVSHMVVSNTSTHVYYFVDTPNYHKEDCCFHMLFIDDCCVKWACDLFFQLIYLPFRMMAFIMKSIGSICCKDGCQTCVDGFMNCFYAPFRCWGDWMNQCWFSCGNFCCNGIDFIPNSISSLYNNCCLKCCVQFGQFLKNCCYFPLNCNCQCLNSCPDCSSICKNVDGECCLSGCCHNFGDCCQNCCSPQGLCEDCFSCCRQCTCDIVNKDCLECLCCCCVQIQKLEIDGSGVVEFVKCFFCCFIETIGAIFKD